METKIKKGVKAEKAAKKAPVKVAKKEVKRAKKATTGKAPMVEVEEATGTLQALTARVPAVAVGVLVDGNGTAPPEPASESAAAGNGPPT